MILKRIAVAFLPLLGMSFGADLKAAELYFTATNSNEIWVADTTGTIAPSALFTNAGPGSRGPVGIDLDKSTGKLFWGTGNGRELWSGNADGSGTPSNLYSSLGGQQHDVDVDETNGRVFFTDKNFGVLVGSTDGSGPVTEVYGISTGNPEALDSVTVAYDDASDQIYFGGAESDSIFVGAADGSMLSALYPASQVRDIAIDPVGGSIFWVDLDSIWKAPIDGTGTPSVLFSNMGSSLRAIEFDGASRRLFLGEFDSSNDVIWTANADGSGTPSVLYSGQFGGIRGLTLVPESHSGTLLFGLLAVLSVCLRRNLSRCGMRSWIREN